MGSTLRATALHVIMLDAWCLQELVTLQPANSFLNVLNRPFLGHPVPPLPLAAVHH